MVKSLHTIIIVIIIQINSFTIPCMYNSILFMVLGDDSPHNCINNTGSRELPAGKYGVELMKNLGKISENRITKSQLQLVFGDLFGAF